MNHYDPDHICNVLAARATQPGTDAKEAQRLNKAEHALSCGLALRQTMNGWLVPSRTTQGTVYRVVVHTDPHTNESDCECDCPRGQVRRRCWHVSLVEVVETVSEMEAV